MFMSSDLAFYLLFNSAVCSLFVGIYFLKTFFLKTSFQKEKLEGYECGFDSFYKKKIGFCVRFFNFSLLFLLIDLEIALLIPFFQKIFLLSVLLNEVFFVFSLVLMFLVLLLVLEFFLGGLMWQD